MRSAWSRGVGVGGGEKLGTAGGEEWGVGKRNRDRGLGGGGLEQQNESRLRHLGLYRSRAVPAANRKDFTMEKLRGCGGGGRWGKTCVACRGTFQSTASPSPHLDSWRRCYIPHQLATGPSYIVVCNSRILWPNEYIAE